MPRFHSVCGVCVLFFVLLLTLPAWGESQPKIIVGADHDNLPYEVLENGTPTGFNIELMRAVAKEMGFEAEFRFDSWNKVRRDLEQGNVDALAGMFFSEERSKSIDFSVPHTMVTPGLFVRTDSSIRTFDDLRGKSIIVQDNDIIHDLLRHSEITPHIIAVKDPSQAIKLLASGKHDSVLTPSKLQSEYFLKTAGITNIHAVITDLPQLRYCFAVRKGNQKLLNRLDEGLNILKINGTYQKIYGKWFGVYEKKNLWETTKYYVLALTLVAALLLASFIWSRSLQKLVRIRTAELLENESELRKAHAELEQRVTKRTADLDLLNKTLVREIAERRKIEEGLRTSNQQLDLLADMAGQLLMSDSPKKALVSLCRRVLDFLGCDVFFNYLVDDHNQRLHLNACRGISNEDAAKMEWLDYGVGLSGCSARDGSRIVVNNLQESDDQYSSLIKPFGITAYACHPLISHGRTLGTLAFCSRSREHFNDDDLSLMKTVADHVAIAMERNQTREQLKQRQEQLEELNRTLDRRVREEVALNRQKDLMLIRQNRQAALGEMLDHIAHQWKQPLNSISLIIQDLGESWSSDELEDGNVEETVDKTMALVEHMSQTINVFRDFYRPEKEKQVFRVKESIDSALAFIAPTLRMYSIAIELDVDPELSAFGYPKEYAQVLLNILANARDAFKTRKIGQPRMCINAFKVNNTSTVTITDNAGGIPESIIDKVFDLYFTTNEAQGGSGIGLYMSKNIIEKSMGGTLDVVNTDSGTQFRIEVAVA
ncbi:MAG: transporter substrate-binding domain-containing protein [Desulfuromonadales bacterium]|nr:transporter substrate-binding domain-containing protein [Desulfuromonadales bacterium]